MDKKLFAFPLVIGLLFVSAFGNEAPPVAIGQLLAAGASLNGTEASPGSTVFSGSRLSTREGVTAVHLSSGHIIELGSQSSAVLQRVPSGEIEIQVVSGSLRFRGADGNLEVAGPADSVQFSQRRAGRPIYQNQAGVVGVLAREAREGQKQLSTQDASRVEPSSELLIRARDGRQQELQCRIRDIRDQVVTVGRDLRFTFAPEDILLQRFPVERHDVYARLSSRADDGDDELKVDDAKLINPLEWVEIRHPNQSIREVACVRYTQGYPLSSSPAAPADAAPGDREETIKLLTDLRNEYPVGSEVLQGVRDEEIRTMLSQEAREGTNTLQVREPDRIDPLMQVLIRSADGSRFEAYCVRSVEGNRVVLAEDLDFDYAAGSEVLQGRSARALLERGVALQRVANCCCCCDGGFAALPFAWWWLIPPAVVPPAVLIRPGDEPPGEGELPPTPIAPRRKP